MDKIYSDKQKNYKQNSPVQIVGFGIGKEIFGVNSLMVQEIIETTHITALPNFPDFIEGAINLRGSIIPVIELRKMLDVKKRDKKMQENSRILIVNVDGRITGFIINSIAKVFEIQQRAIESPPYIVTESFDTQYIIGVCEIDNKLLILLDFSRILKVKEIAKLKEIGNGSIMFGKTTCTLKKVAIC